MKARAAVGGWKLVFEQARRAWMANVWTRPEHSVFALDSFVCDAGVIGRSAAAGFAQLLEHLLRGSQTESVCDCPTGSPERQDFEVAAHAVWRLERAAAANDPSFEIGHRSVFFGPLRAGQHNIGQLGRFGQEKI